jgi:tripartite ATP-independent transporter DctM subunit
MTDTAIGFAGIAGVIGAILMGVNVMVALASVGLLGITVLVGFGPATTLLNSVTFTVVNSFVFTVIPCFLLMGFFAMRAGLGEGLFQAATRWLGRLPGGLAIASTGSAAAFGAASGSSVGTAILFTKLALPEMLARDYDRGFAAACIAISGTLAVLIPPSTLIVIYAILTGTSIGPLLLAGIIPGIIFAVLLCIAILVTALRRPDLAPRATEQYTLREKHWSLRMVGPLLVCIALIIGGLYAGVFTPTEAGGMGALVTFVMAVIRQRGFRGIQIGATLQDTVQLSAMIFAIIIGGLIFARFLALSGVTDVIGGFFIDGNLPHWAVVGCVTLVYLVLGMLLDPPALLAISLPVTMPVMTQLGYDPVWFGIYVVVLSEIACVTPPVGLNCFVVKGASDGAVTLPEIFRGLVPFLIACVLMLALLLAFPGLVTVLSGPVK